MKLTSEHIKFAFKFILISFVGIIWIKIFLFLFYGEVDQVEAFTSLERTSLALPENDHPPKLILNKTDPFLGEIPRKKEKVAKINMVVRKPRKTAIPKVQVFVHWPSISYKGMIINKSKQNVLAMVRVDEQEYISRTGDVIKEVKIQRITSDTLFCIKENETKMILRSS